jgi:hypothetical protein
MKEIREEIKREITDIHTYYEALDGTRFQNPGECQKYEESALGVVRGNIVKLIAGRADNA